MNIIIFGSLGNEGRCVVNEALRRGHKVSAVTKSAAGAEKLPKGVRALVADALNIN
jgi:putative NADH-flavin reductase